MNEQKKPEKFHTVKITLPDKLLNLFTKKLVKPPYMLNDEEQEIICQQSLQCAVSYLLKDIDNNMKEILSFSKIRKSFELVKGKNFTSFEYKSGKEENLKSFSSKLRKKDFRFKYECDKRVLRRLERICFRKDLRTFEEGIDRQENLLILFIRFGLNKELETYKSQSTTFYNYIFRKCKLESGNIKRLLDLNLETVKLVAREKHKSPEDTNGRSIGREIAKLINAKRKLNGLKKLSEEQKKVIIKEARKLYMKEKKNSKSKGIPSNVDLAKQFYEKGTFSEYKI